MCLFVSPCRSHWEALHHARLARRCESTAQVNSTHHASAARHTGSPQDELVHSHDAWVSLSHTDTLIPYSCYICTARHTQESRHSTVTVQYSCWDRDRVIGAIWAPLCAVSTSTHSSLSLHCRIPNTQITWTLQLALIQKKRRRGRKNTHASLRRLNEEPFKSRF